mgnify:CR=1 FL=1
MNASQIALSDAGANCPARVYSSNARSLSSIVTDRVALDRVMLRALAEVPDARLDVHGPALSTDERAHREELERLAGELGLGARVTLSDAVPRARVPELLAASDALVNNMRGGAPDKVVYEAAASCVPVLASNPVFDTLLDPEQRFAREDSVIETWRIVQPLLDEPPGGDLAGGVVHHLQAQRVGQVGHQGDDSLVVRVARQKPCRVYDRSRRCCAGLVLGENLDATLGFIEIGRRDDDSHPVGDHLVNDDPELAPRDRIHAERRLVEQHHLGLVNQGAA